MSGWVRFTPTIPTKLSQISTDVDMEMRRALGETIELSDRKPL